MLLWSDGTIALLCFGASLLHECGHLLFLLLFSADVRELVFSAGGIVIVRDQAFCGTLRESLIALGGIIVNLTLCFSAWLWHQTSGTQTTAVFCLINGTLALLNLLPVRSLDSYRVLELLLQRKQAEVRERCLRQVSLAAVCTACVCCALLTAFGVRNFSLVAVCIYLILLHGKRSA